MIGRILFASIQIAGLCCAQIVVARGGVRIRAGILERSIRIADRSVKTEALRVAGRTMLAQAESECAFTVSRAQPDRRPVGLTRGGEQPTDSAQLFKGVADPGLYQDSRPDAVRWLDPVRIESANLAAYAGEVKHTVSNPGPGITRLVVRVPLVKGPVAGLGIDLNYEIYEGHPAIRKWIEVENGSRHWLKVDHLLIDGVRFSGAFQTRTPLTPEEYGAESSVVAFGSRDGQHGIIAASEVPSALRHIDAAGPMGYRDHLFEWVLGPSEKFASERVFHYAYTGAVQPTISAASTPLDRTVEGPYMRFLSERVGIASEKSPFYAPQWLTWAFFQNNIDDPLVRQLADIAARAGFAQVLLDDGWQKGRLGTQPDPSKFPDFAATARHITALGLSLGLWVSCFRDAGSPDLLAMPDAPVLPLLRRNRDLPGLAMSFSSRWREYYAEDLVRVARRYGVTYFKQDFTNIKNGDFAEGHESRTRRESLLRGLRGLLEAQDLVRSSAPEVVTELTHEIYWGTPGISADLAALEHASQFHIPPNNAQGALTRGLTAEQHRAQLRAGCWQARQRFYAHRGLPLYPLEYYAAATASIEGSLTPAVQDRQVVSWLMGAPLNFSGDLRTLSDENIAHYRRRFDLLRRLESAYGIYRRFQFSGVPGPTDTGWHWWGKLNPEGYGVVVVLRGSAGEERRAVNVPWVESGRHYRVAGLFSGVPYGLLTGRQLRAGIQVALPRFGQDILELAPQ